MQEFDESNIILCILYIAIAIDATVYTIIIHTDVPAPSPQIPYSSDFQQWNTQPLRKIPYATYIIQGLGHGCNAASSSRSGEGYVTEASCRML